MNNRYKVFIDFDGTITSNDVGYELFKKFTQGDTEADVQLYRQGRLSSLECLSRECKIWNKHKPDKYAVYEYLDGQSLSPGFGKFLSALDGYKLKPVILSEGFDFYIDRILSRYELGHIERVTNHAELVRGQLLPEFPYFESGCRQCSNCKGYHIRNYREPCLSAIYIGDGHSDIHASEAADIVFAKSHLKDYLHENGRSFIAYSNFVDVLQGLQSIIEHGVFAQSKNFNFCWIEDRHKEGLNILLDSSKAWSASSFLWRKGIAEKIELFTLPDPLHTESSIHLAIENKAGDFIGSVIWEYRRAEGYCVHDVRLMPEYHDEEIAQEIWKTILERSQARWPDASSVVVISSNYIKSMEMFRDMGFSGQENGRLNVGNKIL